MNSCGTATTGAYFQSGHRDAKTSASDCSTIWSRRRPLVPTTLLLLHRPRFMGGLAVAVRTRTWSAGASQASQIRSLIPTNAGLIPEGRRMKVSSTQMDPRRRAPGSLVGSTLHFPEPSLLTLSKVSRCRSEEHTSELQSLRHLVCRLLLEKK